jgi:hypothetical protein
LTGDSQIGPPARHAGHGVSPKPGPPRPPRTQAESIHDAHWNCDDVRHHRDGGPIARMLGRGLGLLSQSTIFGKLRRQFEILSSSQSYGLVRWTNPPPGHARATRGRRFARGGGPAPTAAIPLIKHPSTGRRSSCLSLAVHPTSAVACRVQTKSQRAAPDSDNALMSACESDSVLYER